LKFLLEITILVSSANNIGSDTAFISGEGNFYIYIYIYIYIVKNRGPRIDLAELHVLVFDSDF
jgi:hypothetical protein